MTQLSTNITKCVIWSLSNLFLNIKFMKYNLLGRCLRGEMINMRDSKSYATEHGGSSPLNIENQTIIL